MGRFHSFKIDEREVPESRHALFLRGLDPDVGREQIQKFFEDEIGKCSMVFYKPTRESVCAAVRFESREDARRCFENFKNRQVLNCNVEISWYRDVRAYAEKMQSRRNNDRKSVHNNNHDRRRHRHRSRSSRSHESSRRRSISRVSISSDEHSPKRKHRRNRSGSSSEHGRRSRSSSGSSQTSSRESRRSTRSSGHSHGHQSGKKPPRTPSYTPPLDQTTEEPLAMSYTSTSPEFVKVEIVGEKKNIGLVTLNRPGGAMNSFCTSFINELSDQISKLDKEKSIGAIVLTGDKEYFASGFEISELLAIDMVEFCQGDFFKNWKSITETTKPLIAAVNGFASGMGCELAMSCDIVYASAGAQFGQPEVPMGTVPSFGGTQLLTRSVGKSLAMEMILTGTRITADEALKRGLISKIYPCDEVVNEAIKLAERISKNSPFANACAKKAIKHAFNSFLNTGLDFENQMYLSTFSTTDRKEGMVALVEKRAPRWKGS